MRISKYTYHILVLFISCLLLTHQCLAQKDSVAKYRNELGIDVLGTIRFFKFPGASDVYSYTPNYFLTYRRYFDRGNIRFGVGGEISKSEQPHPFGAQVTYDRLLNSMDSRFGWEFKSVLTKRWQVFYGIDFGYSILNFKNEASYFSGGYAVGTESHAKTYSLAPVLGFRFKLTDRISLLTEANFSFNVSKSYKNRNFYTIYLPGYLEKPDHVTVDTWSIYTQFTQPLAIYFLFNI